MNKNFLRWFIAVAMFTASTVIAWSWSMSLLSVLGSLALFELLIIWFFPIINVWHNVRRLRKAPVGCKIFVAPFTLGRLSYFRMEYAKAIRNQPISMSVSFDNTITLERID